MLKFWFVLSSSNRFVAELAVCFVLVGVSFGSAFSVKIVVSLLSFLTWLGIVEVVVMIGSWSCVVCVGL